MPSPPSSTAPEATASRTAIWRSTSSVIRSTAIPALTSPTIRPPPSRTGVTTRTEGPRVPV
ncbi:hypothetical protein [Streptomyces radiopugnans]|uniref:hypothetical protein n=1 Tax=Streptomyces radiopugnans TaxID=403935 RepID=UPI003F1D0FD5